MTFETLEQRNLFADIAFTVPHVTARGSLYITGTDASDRITVTRGEGGVAVNVNGLGYNYGRDVKRLFIDAGAGDDRVTVKIARRSNLVGGAGNDTLIGGAADDLIDGGTGSNRLYGRGGVNTYEAANGTNLVFSERKFAEPHDRVTFGTGPGPITAVSLQPPGGGTLLTTATGTTRLFGEGVSFTIQPAGGS